MITIAFLPKSRLRWTKRPGHSFLHTVSSWQFAVKKVG